jgi:hypothetical protein
MSQSIAAAVKYIKKPEELQAVLEEELYCKDLIRRDALFLDAATVKYQHITFDSYALGDYSAATGYAAKGIVSEWKTLTLTQDKGNSLAIDRIKEDEQVTAIGIVNYVKQYIRKVQQPAVDKYVFNAIATKAGVSTIKETLSNTTALGGIKKAMASLKNNGISRENMILYVSPTVKAFLDEQSFGKGILNVGNWNGDMSTQVQMIDGAKVVEVPNTRLPAGVQYILCHKDACPVFVHFEETEFFDKVPGHGTRKSQADIGFMYDAFVYDDAVKAVVIGQVNTYTLAFQDGNALAGAVTAAPTTLTTLTLNEGQIINLPASSGFVLATHNFLGWNTANEFTANPPYADEAVYTVGNANATLYGCWVLKA